MGPNADTATIGPNTSPEDLRGASTDDPDRLRKISSLVSSDLWWAEQECKGLKKETVMSKLWISIVLLLILIFLTLLLFTDWLSSEIGGMFPSLLIWLFVIPIAIIVIKLGVGPSPKDLYEEKHARVQELKVELGFIQDKIERIEDAQR